MTTRRVFTLLLLLPFITAGVGEGVEVKQQDLSASGDRFTYQLGWMQLVSEGEPDQSIFEADFHYENMEVFRHGPAFVRAVPGATQATASITFDFSDLDVTPTNVVFRDSLFLFGANDGERVHAHTAYRVDDGDWVSLQETTTEEGHGINAAGISIPLNQSDRVTYRVEFKVLPDDTDGVFTQSRNQWGRTGGEAQSFRATFDLAPRPAPTGALVVSVEAVDDLTHVIGEHVYPESILRMEDERAWRFSGATRGHQGGIEQLAAPGRDGKAMKLWMSLDRERDDAPRWVFWRHLLYPELSIAGVERAEIDIMPLDPIPFNIMAALGEGDGIGVIPATWFAFGPDLEVGVWQTLSIPVNPARPHVDSVRFNVRVDQAGIPHQEEVRFLLGEVRLLPQADPVAARFISGLDVATPIRNGFIQLLTASDLADDSPLAWEMQLALDSDLSGVLEITARVEDQPVKTWQEPLNAQAPYAHVRGAITALAEVIHADMTQIDIAIRAHDGRQVASVNVPLRLYQTQNHIAKREALYARYQTLHAQWENLREQGLIANRVGASLAVAQWFLQPDGLLDDDFIVQQAYAMADINRASVVDMLDRAETELQDLQAGRISEHPVDRFDPHQPVYVKDGVFHQAGKPMVFIGGINWRERIEPHDARITERIGFNAASWQTRMRDWIDDTENAAARRATYMRYLNETLAAGLAANALLSGHYPPRTMQPEFEGASDIFTGSSMLPWNLLAPQTRAIYAEFYRRVLPIFEPFPQVISFETANEPQHIVRSPDAPHYGPAFREWLQARYNDIAVLNQLWGAAFDGFGNIELPAVFALREESLGANYDWHEFLAEVETDFFRDLMNAVRDVYPDREVVLKLMGDMRHFGYNLLDEQRIVREAQTLIGTDMHMPIWQDYLKSIKPDAPIINGEWHIVQDKLEKTLITDPAWIDRLVFEGPAHGLGFGAMWNFGRRPWDTLSLGARESITRWPTTLEALGRGAWKARAVAGPLGRFANQDGGRIRLLYSNADQLHQGIEYADALYPIYHQLSRNASGVRFIIPLILQPEDLDEVTFIATGAAQYIPSDTAETLANWVEKGGTLWLTEPGLHKSPYGHYHEGISSHWMVAVSTEGEHTVGKGRVMVSPDVPALEAHIDGPWPLTISGGPDIDVKVRLVDDGSGGHWIYIMNMSDAPRSVTLTGWPDTVASRAGEDRWGHGTVNLVGEIALHPHQVILVNLKP